MRALRSFLPVVPLVIAAGVSVSTQPLQAQSDAADPVPMTWLDVQHLRSPGSPTPSPDGSLMVHTVRVPNWQEAEAQTDLYIVSLRDGVSTNRQLTFTAEHSESAPAWMPDNRHVLFLSNLDAPDNNGNRQQLYVMAIDGGGPRRLTDASRGVSRFDVSPDNQWIVFHSGERDKEQLHRISVADVAAMMQLGSTTSTVEASAITDHASGIERWAFSPDGAHIWFTALDSLDTRDRERRDHDFTVKIRNQVTPLSSLWRVAVSSGDEAASADRMAGGDGSYSVESFEVSPDGRWVGFSGGSADRYQRNITQSSLFGDLYLLDAESGQIERLTDTFEAGPGGLSFSPDSRWIAWSAPLELQTYTMGNRRLYLRETAAAGAEPRILGTNFDGQVSASFWSEDGSTIYFNEGWRATRQLFALDVRDDEVRPVTEVDGALSVSRDEDTGTLLITYQDPTAPTDVYTARSINDVGNRDRWVRLSDVNPQVRGFKLGREEEITWTSTDGVEVGGVLNYPVDYEPGRRYPLIVAIHGGPAAADVLGFNGGYGSQVYAGAGYVVLKPNYRGSSNYGEAFRTAIVGDYFPQGYDDIMTGVDHLIAEGIVDGDKMGALGWSAGGHWSNWILVSTDRFKAISSGAGTMNWISMYAQSDVQRNRQFYLGDRLPYEDFEPYWKQSPIQYIKNAKTPTMIHVVEGDPRVPSPQSVELHRALVDLGVPTELFMYPGFSHGIPDPRNRLLKSMSEMAWMDYWVRGIGEGFSWDPILATVERN